MFANREDAGRKLARVLEAFRGRSPVVVGLPRGGVPVAAEVARHLHASLDVILAHKVGAPFNPELAVASVTEDGDLLCDRELMGRLGVSMAYVERQARREEERIQNRLIRYRGDRPALDLTGRVVILVDDGLATGATMEAAIMTARARRAATVVVAVPVAPEATLERLRPLADYVIALDVPPGFMAVGMHYRDFDAVSDDVVWNLLRNAGEQPAPATGSSRGVSTTTASTRPAR